MAGSNPSSFPKSSFVIVFCAAAHWLAPLAGALGKKKARRLLRRASFRLTLNQFQASTRALVERWW
jgi:hypothetical protein